MLKQMISDYCEVTGRPLFTITVDEYLKFAEATNTSVYIPPARVEEKPVVARKEQVEVVSKESLPVKVERVSERVDEPEVKKEVKKPAEKKSEVSKLGLLKSIVG